MESQKKIAAIYLTKNEFIPELCNELGEFGDIVNNLVFSSVLNLRVCFALDIWISPQIVHFQSISEAAKILRQAGKFWYLHPIAHPGRSRLIEEQLRTYTDLTRNFPIQKEIPPIGVFALLDKNRLVYSVNRLKRWPEGNCFFIEDKVNPPNRAYLKLWEALTLLEKYPKPGDSVLDLGASPGGWTYVMQSLGADVSAVDKAELDEKIARLPRVNFIKQSAFALDPTHLNQRFDWVLSDIACYPERAYNLIKKWIDSGKAKQMIFTIKLQGETDLPILKQLQAIPDSRTLHLFYNKHEATFFYPG